MAERHTLTLAKSEVAENRQAVILAAVVSALDELRFGQVVLTVHEGKVVQLDINEKHRFP